MKKTSKQKVLFICNLIFVSFWMLLLFSSLLFKTASHISGWPNWDSYVVKENREHAPKPHLKKIPVREWGSSLEAWYNDNFAWRSRLIQFYRYSHFNWMKTAVGLEVPGLDGWIFRRGGTWAELDDYLGGFELTEKEMDDWVRLFEGRKQWAEAHGTKYMQVITSVKAQIHNEKVFPAIRDHRGVCAREQLQKRLATSSAADCVVFTQEKLLEAAQSRPVFYEEDHHVNAFGVYLIYETIADKLNGWFGNVALISFYDAPPESVLAGKQDGCYEQDRRLAIVAPEQQQIEDPLLELSKPSIAFPMVSVAVERPEDGLNVVMANDSFMRFPLYSWNRDQVGKMRFPFNQGVGKVVSLLFLRYSTGRLDYLLSERVPDVIIEQFTECRLSLGVLGLDETMRRASEFERGIALNTPPQAGQRVLVRCVLEDVTDESGEMKFVRIETPSLKITVELLDGGRVVDTATIDPGVKRAVFFKAVESTGGELTVRVTGGKSKPPVIALRM